MAIAKNRKEFKELCLRRLGYPVTKQEITEDQCDDLIDFALSYYSDYHYNGKEKIYVTIQVTQQNIDNGYFELDDSVIGVTEVLNFSSSSAGASIFNVEYQFIMSDMYKLSTANLVTYYSTMQQYQMISQLIGSGQMNPIRFNQHTNRLYLDTNWARIAAGTFIVLQGYRHLDPANYPDIWKDRWLINYTTQLFKKQIGEHLKKYTVTMLAGVNVNGEGIYQEATAELEKLEQDLYNNYTYPPMDFFG